MEKLITVKFKGCYSNEYVFNCFDDVIVGDMVVVDTANGFQIAEVTKLTGEVPSGKKLKEVVCRIDMTNFIKRREKADKLKKLKTKMDKRVKEMQNLAVYEALAKDDPEFAEWLSEFKHLL